MLGLHYLTFLLANGYFHFFNYAFFVCVGYSQVYFEGQSEHTFVIHAFIVL